MIQTKIASSNIAIALFKNSLQEKTKQVYKEVSSIHAKLRTDTITPLSVNIIVWCQRAPFAIVV